MIFKNEDVKFPNIFILAVFAFAGIFFSYAYAYLDPGSGSIIFQSLIGALVGVGIALKLYWMIIKNYLENRSASNISDEK